MMTWIKCHWSAPHWITGGRWIAYTAQQVATRRAARLVCTLVVMGGAGGSVGPSPALPAMPQDYTPPVYAPDLEAPYGWAGSAPGIVPTPPRSEATTPIVAFTPPPDEDVVAPPSPASSLALISALGAPPTVALSEAPPVIIPPVITPMISQFSAPSPVPEPSSVWLMAVASIILVVCRRIQADIEGN